MKRPILLIIRDGWGCNPHPEWNHANAIFLAKTPVNDDLVERFPHVLIKTSGDDVGLPAGVMGNSEVGHQNIGAGRVVEQELMRITGRIRDGSFFRNEALLEAFRHARACDGRVHIMGLCSDGRVHSDLEHFQAVLELSQQIQFPGDRVFMHVFMDGRDTTPHSGMGFLQFLEHECWQRGINPVASVVGRFFAMDRDNRWERIETAYHLLVHGLGRSYSSAEAALRDHYDHPADGERVGDEFVPPSVTFREKNGRSSRIESKDSVIFVNFRGDRPRQLVKAFVLDDFPFDAVLPDGTRGRFGFPRGTALGVHFVTMTAYETGLPVNVAFPKPPKMERILGAFLSERGLRQFRCAETEKYPHVTFFFNDYRDEPFPGESRAIVPSPRDVSTYDQKPEMSAREVTRAVLWRLENEDDDVFVVNFANADMVGHTGNLAAAVRAVETVDECVGKVVNAALLKGGAAIVTADHGNCEQMIDPATGGPHTAHTTFDVDLILADPQHIGATLRTGGRLADIAPTMLTLLESPVPSAMTGRSLLEVRRDSTRS